MARPVIPNIPNVPSGGGGRGSTTPGATTPTSPTGSGSIGVGFSPTGTTSPNSGAAANTNGTYRGGAFSTNINYQGAVTSYTTADTDYQGLVVFNESSAVAVTLHYQASQNFQTVIFNLGAGAITLTPSIPPEDSSTTLYTINGSTSMALSSGQGAIVGFADRLWYAKAI